MERVSEKERTKFLAGFEDQFDASEESLLLLRRIIRQSPKWHIRKTVPVLKNLLEKRVKNLSYRGRSEAEKRLARFRNMFKLTEQESEFCRFLYIVTLWKQPEEYFIDHLSCNSPAGQKYLTTILDISAFGLQRIFGGVLSRIGFYEMDQHNFAVSDEFHDFFLKPASQWTSKHLFEKVSRKVIPLENHLINPKHTEHVLKLLTSKKQDPVHILLYGPAGTGKTSYAHGIARKAGITTYEILRDTSNETYNRRAALVACRNMTSSEGGSLIIVDEADNLLNTEDCWLRKGETQDKGWLNQFMEEPHARMIWITNSIWHIEESVRQRFAFSLQFKPLNRTQQIQLWESVLRQNRIMRLFSRDEITDLSSRYRVNAGIVDMAVKKALITYAPSDEAFKEIFRMSLDAYKILDNNGIKPRDKEGIERNYSLDGLNIEGDLPAVINQLVAFDRYLKDALEDDRKNFNLLFYGPPGTGKSELVRYLARHVQREIVCKRLSDILDCWVGSTEQNIARAFSEAEAEEAILIIDEADSLLFSRDRAVRSWETSFTNEFLTQMERFRGILICTTNRLGDLDNASIRRFNHKIGFDYLKPDGNVTFYVKMLIPLTAYPMNAEVEAELKKMIDLTPGDFRIVRDRYAFYPKEKVTHGMMLQALAQEILVKKVHGAKKHIGF
ncbi:MAG: ATP-binding protein [Deltaproteobacteria bacterium]|nr:ATP-binding protein [Deltaproteobacteria bacterium]